MKKLLLTTLTVFALSLQVGCTSDDGYGSTAKPADKSTASTAPAAKSTAPSAYESALKSAKKEIKKAKKAGMLWKTIGGKKGLLAKAKKLEKKGNTKKAIKLINTAKAHAILGQKQAVDQANAGPNF
ncbi:MAG: hypothetical protein Ctma_0313 [Catillopecten margaritatus gill symbiont]|uniref:SoxXA-binding protein n=1 Tax=Catillopecten margaritatus gill symbiont TaxID=3083288 RepID=A0AAU6PF15_9GAMM